MARGFVFTQSIALYSDRTEMTIVKQAIGLIADATIASCKERGEEEYIVVWEVRRSCERHDDMSIGCKILYYTASPLHIAMAYWGIVE